MQFGKRQVIFNSRFRPPSTGVRGRCASSPEGGAERRLTEQRVEIGADRPRYASSNRLMTVSHSAHSASAIVASELIGASAGDFSDKNSSDPRPGSAGRGSPCFTGGVRGTSREIRSARAPHPNLALLGTNPIPRGTRYLTRFRYKRISRRACVRGACGCVRAVAARIVRRARAPR